jgi:serine/threonine-protein kinase
VDDRVPAPGEVIASKYEVKRVIGAGGMGVVIEARHLQLNQNVAIKFMRGQASMSSEALGRFQREARAAASLTSEHVAKVFDVGTLETGAPYIVLEYLAGVDLGQILRREGPMPLRAALGAVLQACEAVAEAHAIGIVHRDLKPSNLFATRRKDGSLLVKVLDFGISKVTDLSSPSTDEGLTASGYIMGSPGYMSPEQVRSAKTVDARSDVWAIGVILYELLTGVSPFQGQSLGDTFARIVSETPPRVSERRPDIPKGVADAIANCLERDLQRRTRSLAVLASALAPFAPPEAALSVERILRVLNPAGGTVAGSSETLAAPGAEGAVPFTPAGGVRGSRPDDRIETGPPWNRSQPGYALAGGRRRGQWTIPTLAAAGVALVGSIGLYSWHRTANAPAATEPSPAPAAVAPPATHHDEPRATAVASVETAAPSAPAAEEHESAPADAASYAGTSPAVAATATTARPGGVRRTAPAARPAASANDPSIDGLLELRR